MGKRFLLVVLLCSVALNVPAGQKKLDITKADVIVSKDKPTVYISFERAGERRPVYVGESHQGIWLRLHNNTRWAINFCTESLYIGTKITPLRLSDGRGVLGLRESVEVSPCYDVEAVRGYESVRTPNGELHIEKPVNAPTPPVVAKGHISSTSWLPSGRSVVFSIPREHLARHLAVYISFNYEWETSERDNGSKEPEHRVYFRASDLPEKIQ